MGPDATLPVLGVLPCTATGPRDERTPTRPWTRLEAPLSDVPVYVQSLRPRSATPIPRLPSWRLDGGPPMRHRTLDTPAVSCAQERRIGRIPVHLPSVSPPRPDAGHMDAVVLAAAAVERIPKGPEVPIMGTESLRCCLGTCSLSCE